MIESATVTVGLDVHARSIRLAAVRADELLEQRTLPYDEEVVERLGPKSSSRFRRMVVRIATEPLAD